MFFESKPKEAEEINSFDNDAAIAEKKNLLVEQEETMKNCEKKSESKSSISNLMWNLSEIEARDLCKHQIDTMEHWSRRLIDESLKSKYGDDYFEKKINNDQPLVKKEIRDKVYSRIKDNPERFGKKVDALVIEDIEYFFCREDLYNSCFKDVFSSFFSGVPEIRAVLHRISSIRNKIAHGNPISQHEIEQAVCYSNDFIEVFRRYYTKCGKDKIYNVPTFIAFSDSLGRSVERNNSSSSWELHEFELGTGEVAAGREYHFRSGDSYRLILEVDASYPKDAYDIKWWVVYNFSEIINVGKGNIIEFKLDDRVVSSSPMIRAEIITKRSWHRDGNWDDLFVFHLGEVYPPIEDDFL